MLSKLIIGQYVPRDSLIHKLDARTKLITVFLFVIVIFLANNVVTYLLMFAYVAGIVILSKLPFGYILKGLKPILIIVIITFVLHIFLTKEGTIWLELGSLKVYSGGVVKGLFIAARFLLLVTMTTLLTLTTTPMEITDGLEYLFSPLKKIKIPVHEISLMMSISLRFIPTLLLETEKIMKAQTARGVEFSSGSPLNRVKAIVPLLIPLFVSAFKRADELAIAMEARGYHGGEGRTKYRQSQMDTKDYMVIVSILVISAMLYLLKS